MTTIEIDLELLLKEGVSPDEYVMLCLTHQNVSAEEIQRIRSSCSWEVDVEKLEEKGFIKIMEGKVVVREKLKQLMGGNFERSFAELLSTYPMKVGTPGNYRVLRANDPTAKANDVARNRYKKILHGKPQLHEKILRLLNVQLESQRDKLQFLPAFEVWLNARTWERWEGMENTDDSSETRITNVL